MKFDLTEFSPLAPFRYYFFPSAIEQTITQVYDCHQKGHNQEYYYCDKKLFEFYIGRDMLCNLIIGAWSYDVEKEMKNDSCDNYKIWFGFSGAWVPVREYF